MDDVYQCSGNNNLRDPTMRNNDNQEKALKPPKLRIPGDARNTKSISLKEVISIVLQSQIAQMQARIDTVTQALLNAKVPLLELPKPEIPRDPSKGKQVGDHPKKKLSQRPVEKLVSGSNERSLSEKDLQSIIFVRPSQRKDEDLQDTIICNRAQKQSEFERQQPEQQQAT